MLYDGLTLLEHIAQCNHHATMVFSTIAQKNRNQLALISACLEVLHPISNAYASLSLITNSQATKL